MRRGKLEMYLALLFAYNGITKRTRVIQTLSGMSTTPGKKISLFLVENGFIEKVYFTGTQYTYRRTKKGEEIVKAFINGDMRCFIDNTLPEIYERSEKERKLLEFKHFHKRRVTARVSIIAQKMSVLELLKHGARYPSSRIKSYSFAVDSNILQVLEELVKDGLITLYPNRRKRSIGDYGITGAGRRFILRGGE